MADDAIRVDKWLWYARVTKTRTLAASLVREGRVRINRERIDTPSRLVRPGDVLTINAPRDVLVYEIAAIAQRRGPYSEARELYVDLSPRAEKTTASETEPEAPATRPDSRARKAIASLRGKIDRG